MGSRARGRLSSLRSTDHFADGPFLSVFGAGEWRIWLLAALAGLAVCAPAVAKIVGPLGCTAIFLTGQPRSLRFDLPNRAAVAIAVWAASSILWSVNAGVSFRGAIEYTALAVTFIATRDALHTVVQLRAVVVGYLTGCLILVGRILVLTASSGFGHGTERLNLPDVNANYAGYALSLGFAMLVLLWVASPPVRRRGIVSAIVTTALLLGVFLAATRAALVGIALLALWILVSRLLKRPPLKALVTAAITIALTIVTGIADRASLLLEGVLGRSTGDWSGRLEVWPLAREWWLKHFIAGSGVSTFQGLNVYHLGAHNLILEIGTGMGLIGVTLFLALIWSCLDTTRERAATRLRPFLIGSFIVVSAFSYLTGHWELSPAAWFGLAIVSRIDVLFSRSLIEPDLSTAE